MAIKKDMTDREIEEMVAYMHNVGKRGYSHIVTSVTAYLLKRGISTEQTGQGTIWKRIDAD